jgi:hypothetical protein
MREYSGYTERARLKIELHRDLPATPRSGTREALYCMGDCSEDNERVESTHRGSAPIARGTKVGHVQSIELHELLQTISRSETREGSNCVANRAKRSTAIENNKNTSHTFPTRPDRSQAKRAFAYNSRWIRDRGHTRRNIAGAERVAKLHGK